MACCGNRPSPKETMKSPKEKIIYLTCIQPDKTKNKPDYLATVDVDPTSKTYSQVIHRLPVSSVGDELHHSGWNACVSCEIPNLKRNRLLLPCLNSDRIYIIDTDTDPLAPQIYKTIEPDELHKNHDLGAPHTVHCLPSGEVMISTMGDAKGNAKGSFLLLDGADFKIKGTWEPKDKSVPFGYDFWYQPRQNVMVSSEWGAPNAFRNGLRIDKLEDYGHCLHFWDWTTHNKIQDLDLGKEKGLMPLEVRFLHSPEAKEGYVGCALGSSVFRFYRKDETWHSEKVIHIPVLKVDGWILPEMPSVITDILISLDDRFLYLSNWIQGDIRQYDISNTSNPKLVGQIYLGGSMQKDGGVTVTDSNLLEQPAPALVKGKVVRGGPQMLQLSLDGKRLYVTTSLYSVWDNMFYPEMTKLGAMMLLIDVDTTHGGLKLNEEFLVDFGEEPDGAVLAHEMRYPGGDCTSDIWP